MPEVRAMAASLLLAPWIDGPSRALHVVHRSSLALSLADANGRVAFSVMTPGAVRLPHACVVAASAGSCPSGSIPSSLSVGDGVLAWDADGSGSDDVRHRVTRWWQPARPRPQHHPRLVALAEEVDETRVRRVTSSLVDRIGSGPGLTPYADDVLCGALITFRGTGHPCLPALVDRVEGIDLDSRTTATSAALLRAACQGWCIDELADLLLTLDRSPHGPAAAHARARLLAVGSSSGRGLLDGVGLALPGLRRVGEAA